MVVDDARSVHFSDPERLQTELLQVLRDAHIVESGPEGDGASLELLQLSGAMTNVIYHCSVFLRGSEKASTQLLVRFYGSGTEQFFARNDEIHVLKALSARGFEPQLLCCFANGRVESWIGDALPASTVRFRDPPLQRMLAKQLYTLHTAIPLPVQEDSNRSSSDALTIMARIEMWANVARKEMVAESFSFDIDSAVASLRNSLPPSPVVFAHCDLQPNNIMISDDFSKLYLIDFEYSGHVERGFDIANHFCEWMSEFDNEEKPHVLHFDRLPTTAEASLFCRSYLECGSSMGSVPDDAVAALVEEVRPFMRASHLMWGLWGMIQSKQSNIGFDFSAYARQRLWMFSGP